MKPLGYWLNRTDRALTTYMDTMLGEFGLTRLAWQVLNVVRDGRDVSDTAVLSAMREMGGTESLTATIELVLGDGWVHRPGSDRLALTESGRTRLGQVETAIADFRELSARGISAEEYRIAVSVLERMTHNLESTEPAG
ncbi:MarR family winged helix-turn-helix transcriptional regulator [Nocardia huaxiensis]|uniref:MarR family transcriptional regulator n=1 Tax=Nocardia huaxiensis TaxID=2755382 RepID=A0A7D6VIC7_9NOCA|nr:MarR family transcriptional regulator [Nocardia huaxiensis]QLY30230.1 MarR family transcriptional regulator [Nocardia huaxiensis]UFS96151.1 hypothetical protein LPY97_36840 [Nocardia huaxiensis]